MDNKLKIINYLGKAFDKEFTMHELSKTLDIPYTSFHRTVNNMKDLLIIKPIGKSKTLRLNYNNPVIQSYLAISSEEEKNIFLKKKPMFKILRQDIKNNDIVLIFGSYAKDKETKRSDIDIIIINKKGNRSISFDNFELLYDTEVNPIFFTIKEYKQMIENNEENVGKQALRYHKVLNNPNDFWNIVINELRKKQI